MYIYTQTDSTVTWEAVWQGSDIQLTVSGCLDYDSYLEMKVVLANLSPAPLSLSDVRLTVPHADPSYTLVT